MRRGPRHPNDGAGWSGNGPSLQGFQVAQLELSEAIPQSELALLISPAMLQHLVVARCPKCNGPVSYPSAFSP